MPQFFLQRILFTILQKECGWFFLNQNKFKMKPTINSFIALLFFAILFTACGKDNKNEASGETTETKTSDGITYYYTVTGEGLTGSMKVARKGDDKFYWERKLSSEGVDVVLTVISDGKYVYVMSDMAGEKAAYKSSMDNYNNSIDKAGQICVINPGRNSGNYDKIGTTKILGDDCTIFQVTDGTKFTVSDDGKTVYGIKLDDVFDVTFTNNQTVPPPDDKLFEVPADIEFEETDDIISKF